MAAFCPAAKNTCFRKVEKVDDVDESGCSQSFKTFC
jgi:hypothetical protein